MYRQYRRQKQAKPVPEYCLASMEGGRAPSLDGEDRAFGDETKCSWQFPFRRISVDVQTIFLLRIL
jgi:hypothetical protein